MKKHTKIQLLSIGAALMVAAGTIPATTTLADVNYGTGKITIEKSANNTDGKNNAAVSYKGFEIFKANVKDDKDNTENTTGKTETNVNWANADVQKAVESVLAKHSDYSGKTAQDAADYIVANITGTDNTTRVDAASFAQELAKAVDGLTKTTTLTPGAQSGDLEEGYWLFTTDDTSVNGKSDLTGTAPIFAVIGGSDVSVTEKTSIPTVTKDVKNNNEGAVLQHSTAVDYGKDQAIDFELTGTVADNIGTFDTYKYKFTDTLPKSMTADKSSVHVYAVNGESKTELLDVSSAEDKTTGYVLSVQDGSDDLTVDFANLKNINAKDSQTKPTINKDTKIVVDYQAKIDKKKEADVVYGGTGNQNTVKLTYSNNPYSEGVGESDPQKSIAMVYTYKLKLHKVDRSNEKDLAGAKFTIQTTGMDKEDKTQYVQNDGTLGTVAHEFTTDDKGEINVTGLDAGTYTVKETAAPRDYDNDLVAGFTFTIQPTYEGETLTSLENKLTATDSVIAGSTDGDTTDNVMKAGNKGDGANKETGQILITVGDTKRISLPLSGQAGITVFIGLGAGILAVSLAAYARNKKKEEN